MTDVVWGESCVALKGVWGESVWGSYVGTVSPILEVMSGGVKLFDLGFRGTYRYVGPSWQSVSGFRIQEFRA